MKLHDKVYDAWWPWDIGVVEKVLKSRLHVRFNHAKLVVYDSAHAKAFLRLVIVH